METPDLELEARWQEAALVGYPQLRSPRKTPQTPRQNPPVSSQEQALSFKRRKGASRPHLAHVPFRQFLCCASSATVALKLACGCPYFGVLLAGLRLHALDQHSRGSMQADHCVALSVDECVQWMLLLQVF